MSVSFGITEKIVVDGDTPITQATTLTADKRESYSLTVPIANDQLVALVLDVSQVKAIVILSDQDLTLETNNSGTPVDTLALKANVPYFWYTNKPQALAFGTDITALYVTNASAAIASLKIEILVDPTV
jgi:hypothetical protein